MKQIVEALMSEDEIDVDALIAKSEQIETHERHSETDDDDYVVMDKARKRETLSCLENVC